jgi:opacity protein-like surface antigen
MKKVLVIAVMTACMFSLVSAQEKYKPVAGDFSLEVGFAPFGSTIINDGALAGFFHFSDNVALRVGLGFGFGTDFKDKTGETGDKLDTERKSNFGLSISPGIVYSFKGTPRLTPYIGAGLNVGFRSTTEKTENGSVTKKVNHVGGFDTFTFGLGVGTGFNYYVAKNLYVGAEVDLGFDFISYPNEKTTYSGNGAPSNDAENKAKHRGMDIGINAYPLLRLGWTF